MIEAAVASAVNQAYMNYFAEPKYRVDMLYGWAVLGANPYVPPKPCPYCHRTKQKPEHKSCDGCGAPR